MVYPVPNHHIWMSPVKFKLSWIMTHDHQRRYFFTFSAFLKYLSIVCPELHSRQWADNKKLGSNKTGWDERWEVLCWKVSCSVWLSETVHCHCHCHKTLQINLAVRNVVYKWDCLLWDTFSYEVRIRKWKGAKGGGGRGGRCLLFLTMRCF